MSDTEVKNVLRTLEPLKAHCEKHGDYESKNIIGKVWSKCPECSADKIAAEMDSEKAEQKIARARAWQTRLDKCGIASRFRDRDFENYAIKNEHQRKCLAFARQYADDFGSVLESGRCAIFIGNPGTGKTHLASAIAITLLKAKRTVIFTTVLKLIRRVRDTWARDSQFSEADVVKDLASVDLLILDEVGIQYGTESEKIILFDVLNSRYESRKPTLLMSNLTLDELKSYLGERVFDRLREDGGEAIVFNWQSHRGQK